MLVMKPCILAMTTMVLQFMLERRPCTILCFNVHITVECLNRNISIGQSLKHISKYIVVCVWSRPEEGVCQAYSEFAYFNVNKLCARFQSCNWIRARADHMIAQRCSRTVRHMCMDQNTFLSLLFLNLKVSLTCTGAITAYQARWWMTN